MILSVKKVIANEGYSRTAKVIDVTDENMSNLNKRIAESIKQNDNKREKGLEVAARCRMR